MNASKTIEMQNEGRSTGQGVVEKTMKPSLIMTPQVCVGGRMPIPKNESTDSVSMAPGIAKATVTMTGARMFGKTCLRMMRPGPAPIARAASTNSRFFVARTWPRTSRATPTQFTTAMPTKITRSPS